MATQGMNAKRTIASWLIGIAIVLIFGLIFVGASGNFEGLPGFGGNAVSSSQSERSVVDSVGRTVAVPENPNSIAVMDAFSGNVAVLTGAGDRMMGVPGGVKSNKLLEQLFPGLGSIQQLSGNSVNVEELLSHGVDLALVRRDLYENSGEMAKLDKVGIPYVVVTYDSVPTQSDAIRLVGEACGGECVKRAASVADYYDTVSAMVQERTSSIPEEERTSVYHSINDPLLTDGTDSLGADWIELCGAIDVSAQQEGVGGLGDYSATLEQVYSWNPDVVVCSTTDARSEIEQSAQWSGLDAVAQGRVYNLPVSTSRWGQRGDPETFLAMLWLSKTIYPDLFEDVDLKETVTAYYRDVIGLTIDDELWDTVLSGQGLRTQGNGGQGE